MRRWSCCIPFSMHLLVLASGFCNCPTELDWSEVVMDSFPTARARERGEVATSDEPSWRPSRFAIPMRLGRHKKAKQKKVEGVANCQDVVLTGWSCN